MLTRFRLGVGRLRFFSTAFVLLTYKIFEIKIYLNLRCRLVSTFSGQPFTKSGLLAANSVIKGPVINYRGEAGGNEKLDVKILLAPPLRQHNYT